MFRVRLLAVLLPLLLAASADAQAPPAAGGRPVRVVIASSRLPSVVDTPLYFRLVRVTLAAGQSGAYTGASSMVYVASGVLDLTVDGERRSLREGSAGFVPAGRPATLAAGGAPATLLQFVLAPAADLDRAGHSGAATVTEIYRTPRAIPALKPGPHEFTMTRVSVERGSPRPPMHYRAGAALYYVLAGAWTLHEDGAKQEARLRGAVQFEPNDFVHSWQNTGDATGVLLQANVSPEGSPEIIFLPAR
jgi:quercetin dioxygenase-like cupin family protein